MITIIERRLDVINGHEHTQVEAIRSLAPTGTSIQVLTHKEFVLRVEQKGALILPTLCDHKSIRHDEDASLALDLSAVESHLRTTDCETDVVVVPSAYAYEIRLCLKLVGLSQKIRCALRVLRPEPIGELSKEELERLRDAIKCGHMSLHTELSELSDRLIDCYSLPAEPDFLLPSTVNPNTKTNVTPKHTKARPFRIGNLGNYRSEKGSDRIPAIIRALVEEMRANGNGMRIELLLQIPGRIRQTPRKLLYITECYRASLRQGFSPNLKLKWYKGGLSPDQFHNQISSIDLMLVPYLQDAYRYRGSGIIVDAVLASRAIVYSDGIGMQRFLSHGNARSAGDPAGFAREIVDMAQTANGRSSALQSAKLDVQSQLERTRNLLATLA